MSRQAPIKLGDLEDALLFVSGFDAYDKEGWVCRATGKVIWHGEDAELWDPVPDDIDEGDRYVTVPDKHDLGLGSSLPLEFTRERLPECYDEVQRIFSRRRAFARFKDLLDRRDSLDAWYQWEQDKTRAALREWCDENGIPVAD